ncbi:MAG: tetratricopeptide repeat-containing sulfotransferase family protein, partial [Gammaproteobacteria bacterium]
LGLANLASQAGDFEEAERLLRHALALDPDLYGAWDLLSTIRSGPRSAALAGELDAVAERAGDNPAAFLLHFARGRVRERLGDYDAAFAAYEMGNRIRIGKQPYSRTGQVAFTRNILEHLNESFVSRDIAGALPDPGIIFICGMHRSGTTLVETILASHPEVSPGGEMIFVQDWLRREQGRAKADHTGNWLREAPDALLTQLARDWREHLITPKAGRARITDKLPGNYPILGLLHLCFPTAPIVHVRRDARDNCFSCFATVFASGYAFSSALESMGHFYRLYECFMRHWRQTLGAERIIEIEYEKLVHNPESEVRRLLAAVGLDWDARCLDFHRTARNVHTPSVYQVRQPLYTSSIGRWRRFEHHLGPLIAELEGPAPL